MRRRELYFENPIYELVFSPDGGVALGELIRTEQITLIELYADEGKHFVRKSDGVHLAEIITLGSCDSEDNYCEVYE